MSAAFNLRFANQRGWLVHGYGGGIGNVCSAYGLLECLGKRMTLSSMLHWIVAMKHVRTSFVSFSFQGILCPCILHRVPCRLLPTSQARSMAHGFAQPNGDVDRDLAGRMLGGNGNFMKSAAPSMPETTANLMPPQVCLWALTCWLHAHP